MKPFRFTLAVFAAILAPCLVGPGRAADAALVVGVGTTSFPAKGTNGVAGTEHPAWRIVEHHAAREEAEQAFRELVRAAAAGPLYSVGALWYDDGPGQFSPAVLLTDGTTDNRAIPSVPVLRRMGGRAFETLQPRDDAVVFLAGLGEAHGRASWIYGRRGGVFPVEDLAARLFDEPSSGLRILVARLYPAEGERTPATLLLADPRSAARLRAWSQDAADRALKGEAVAPPGRLFPGWSRSLAAAAPTRLARVRDVLREAPEEDQGLVVIDLGTAADRQQQRVDIPVDLRDETLYQTNRVRRPGPLFTIVEEEFIEPVGTRTTIDAAAFEKALISNLIPAPAARTLAETVRSRVPASFDSTNRVGATDFQLTFDHGQRRAVIVYFD